MHEQGRKCRDLCHVTCFMFRAQDDDQVSRSQTESRGEVGKNLSKSEFKIGGMWCKYDTYFMIHTLILIYMIPICAPCFAIAAASAAC